MSGLPGSASSLYHAPDYRLIRTFLELMVLNNHVNLNNSHPELRPKIVEMTASESSSDKSPTAVAEENPIKEKSGNSA